MTTPRPVEEPVYAKVIAGTTGAGVGAAFAAIIVFILGAVGVDAGPIEWALAVVLSAAGSFAGGYAKREDRAR